MSKRIMLILTLLVSLGLIAACGGAATPAPDTSPAEEEAPAEAAMDEEPAAEAPAVEGGSVDIEPIRIAVVMPSPATDLAWSQALIDSLQGLQEQAGGEDVVEIAVSESMFNVTDAAAALRDYAADGYDLIIAHGTQYGSSMFEIAPDFPETSFAWGTATDTGESEGLQNVFAYEARAEEGGYVNESPEQLASLAR
jgi:basic membrane protein A